MEPDDWKTWGGAYSIRLAGKVMVKLRPSECRPGRVETIRVRLSGGADAERVGSKSCEWVSLAGVEWSGRC